MRSLVRVLPILALLTAFGLPTAMAQTHLHDEAIDPPELQPIGALTLLQMPIVLRELGLTPQQYSKIQALKRDLDAEFKAPFESAQKEKWPEGFHEFEKLAAQYRQLAEARSVEPLNWNQRARLRSLQYQSLGFRALLMKELVAKLALRPDQTAMLEQISRQASAMRSRFARRYRIPDAPGDYKAGLDRIEADFESQALTLLDPPQAREYRSLLGALLPSVAGTAPFVSAITVD